MNRKAFSLIELSIVIIVVLVLITGLIKSSSLIYKTKLLSARSRTQNSPVSSISNLVLWMETTKEGAILNTDNSNNISDGDYVLSWTDINTQMPFPLVFTSSSGSYPIYIKDAINGLPAIKFDGVNDYLDTPDEPRIHMPLNMSLFVVFTPISGHSTDTQIGILSKQHPTTANLPYDLTFNGTNMTARTRFISDSTVVSLGSDYKPLTDDKAAIITAINDISNDTTGLKIFVDGEKGNEYATPATEIKENNSALSIARQKGFWATRYCKCYISEIIMYNKPLKTKERESVEKYLSQKWAISISS